MKSKTHKVGNIFSSKFYWFISPQFIFLLPLLQVIFVYIYWLINGKNINYDYNITYWPLLTWIFGYIFFLMGCNIVKSKSRFAIHHPFNISLKWLRYCFAVWFFLFASTVYIYGGLALYKIYLGDIDIREVNLIQSTGFFGQFGLFLIFTILCSVIYCLLILSEPFQNKVTYKNIFLIAAIVGSLSAGKRQGLFILITLMVVVHIINLSKTGRRVKLSLFFTIIFGIILAICIFEYIGYLRGAGLSFVSYLEYPIINFEWQISTFGVSGPNNLFPLISGFIPYKILFDYSATEYIISGEESYAELIFGFRYPEPGIGAGFYGPIHLGFGLSGCLLYALIFGIFIGYIYRSAHSSLNFKIIYGLCAWPLVSALSYNLFLISSFFVLPTLCALILIKLSIVYIGPYKKSVSNGVKL
jgi:oligosaccharide repeat unit polymerase